MTGSDTLIIAGTTRSIVMRSAAGAQDGASVASGIAVVGSIVGAR
jgi:hypothetical protein